MCGGKRWRHDGGDDRVEFWPCCRMKIFDNAPGYDEAKAHNDAEDERYTNQRDHQREYNAGERDDPLVDKDSKQIKKVELPKYKPLLLHCHQYQNFHSLVVGGKTCFYKCKVDGEQFQFGKCPACLGSCSFVWDRHTHADKVEYFELNRIRKETLPSERDEANHYLDNMH